MYVGMCLLHIGKTTETILPKQNRDRRIKRQSGEDRECETMSRSMRIGK